MNNKSLKHISMQALQRISRKDDQTQTPTTSGLRYHAEILLQAHQLLLRSGVLPTVEGNSGYEEALDEVASDLLVIDYLTSMGDDLSTVALLEYTASFPRMDDVAAFAIAIMREGYSFEGFVPESNPAYPFRVYFTRESTLSAVEVCATTLALIRHARSHAGIYEGWETTYSEEAGVAPAVEVLARARKLRH